VWVVSITYTNKTKTKTITTTTATTTTTTTTTQGGAAQRRTPSRVQSSTTALAADGADDGERVISWRYAYQSAVPPPRGFQTTEIDTDWSASPWHDRFERITTIIISE